MGYIGNILAQNQHLGAFFKSVYCNLMKMQLMVGIKKMVERDCFRFLMKILKLKMG